MDLVSNFHTLAQLEFSKIKQLNSVLPATIALNVVLLVPYLFLDHNFIIRSTIFIILYEINSTLSIPTLPFQFRVMQGFPLVADTVVGNDN